MTVINSKRSIGNCTWLILFSFGSFGSVAQAENEICITTTKPRFIWLYHSFIDSACKKSVSRSGYGAVLYNGVKNPWDTGHSNNNPDNVLGNGLEG